MHVCIHTWKYELMGFCFDFTKWLEVDVMETTKSGKSHDMHALCKLSWMKNLKVERKFQSSRNQGKSIKWRKYDIGQKVWLVDIFPKPKRKSRKSSSTSSEEDNRPSEDKRSTFDLSEEDCRINEVHSELEMVEGVLPKLDVVLKRLEVMETKLDNLGSYIKNVDAKVNKLTMKVETLEVLY